MTGKTTIKLMANFCHGAGLGTVQVAPGYCLDMDPACEDYDWLVVFDELPVNDVELRCPRERTMLVTWEPVSIKGYSRGYTRQFGHLLTNRPPEAERHPHYHLGRGYFLSFVPDAPTGIGTVAPGKVKTVSAVCSNKQMRHTAHNARFELMRELSRAIPGFDWYGRGVRPLEKKSDALIPYRYHVAVENHIAVHHWTEQVSDAFLCECLPFYAGDPELGQVLPPESFIPIPIDDPEAAADIIRSAIANDEYAKRLDAILEAKRRISTEYNFISQVLKVVKGEADQPVTPPDPARPAHIRSRHLLRKTSPFVAVEDLWMHVRRGFR